MPYKRRRDKLQYDKGYYAGYRRATIDHLGGKCQVCGSTEDLELDHNPPLNRKARSLMDLKDLSKVRLVCKRHHKDRGNHY